MMGINKILIVLLTVAMVLGLCACIGPAGPTVPGGQPSEPKNTMPTTQTDPTQQPPEDAVLSLLRQEMEMTPTLTAVAYLGFVHEPWQGTVAQLLKELCPEMVEMYPFMAQIPEDRLLGGSTGELYLVVPRDRKASVRVGLLEDSYGMETPNTQVIYQAERGDPFLLIANGGDTYPDHQVLITEPTGQQLSWYPYRNEDGYVNLPIHGDTVVALDLTYRAGLYEPLEDWMKYGWSMPEEELLYTTGWMFRDPLDQVAIVYCLDLLSDGSAALYSYIDGEMDHLEEYHGIWYCHVEGQFRYLNLSMERTGGTLAQPDEVPVVIMDTFPILVHLDEMSLVLGKGLYGCELPFATDGEITAVFVASAG